MIQRTSVNWMTQQRTPHHVTSTEGLVTNSTTHKRFATVCRKVGNWSGVQTKMLQGICGAFRLCLWPLFSNSKVREFKLNFFCEWVKGGVRTPYFLRASEKKMKVYKEKFTSVLFTFTIYGGKQWYYLPDLAKTWLCGLNYHDGQIPFGEHFQNYNFIVLVSRLPHNAPCHRV